MKTGSTGSGPTRVLIVDDHEVVRAGLRSILDTEPLIEVVGTAPSGRAALAILEETEVDVVVLDYGLPGMRGSTACAEIVKLRPRTAVVILTSYMDDDVVLSCLSAGARAFLIKSVDVSGLADIIQRVARGEAVLAPETIERVLQWAREAKFQSRGVTPLPPFDVEILRLLSEGESNRRIAQRFGVTEDTVKVRVRSIKRRLGASDRAQAVALAIRKGLI